MMSSLMAVLGMDVTPFRRSINDASVQAKALGETIAKNMEHAEHGLTHAMSGGRALHHALVEISNVSPIMGNALRFALNPIALLMVTLATTAKHLHEEFKELGKVFDEVSKAQAGPAIGQRALSDAQRQQRKEDLQDHLRAEKEMAEQNDPLKQTMERLRRQEEAFNLEKDFAAKLALQKKTLADIDKEMETTRATFEQYNAPAAGGERDAMRRRIAEADAFIKTSEQKLAQQKEIQARTKEAFEEQEAIDSGGVIGKALHFGDTVRQQMAEQYRKSIEMEEAYQRSIDKTRDTRDKFDEQLKRGLETHEEAKRQLNELQQAHERLSSSVAKTEMQEEKQEDKEMKEEARENRYRAPQVSDRQRIGAYVSPMETNMANIAQKSEGHLAAILSTLHEHTKLLKGTRY